MPPNIYDVMRDEADQQADYDKDIFKCMRLI